MSFALLLVPDFSLILIGWLLVRYTPFDRAFWAGVERLVYFVLFPALLLQSTNSAKFDFSSTSAMLGLALFTILQPVSGRLSDRFGRRPLLLFFAIGSALMFIPLMSTVGQTMSSVLVAVSVSAVLLAAYAGSLAAVMAEQFPPEVRTAGISLPYGIAVAVFGGLAPVLATATVQAGRFWVFEGVMVALCIASALVYWRMRETRDDRWHKASRPVATEVSDPA